MRMFIYRLKLLFRGREAWRSLNKFIFIGVYTLLIIGMMFFPKAMGWIMLVLGIILPSYIALFVNHLREMEKLDKGNKLIEGWITHAFGVGERVYFTPTRFQRVDKLSPENLETIMEYVKTCDEYSKAAKIDIGFDRFKPTQPTIKEIISKETMIKEEMKAFINEELAEFKNLAKEFKEIIHKNSINKIEVKSKDEADK